MKFGYTIIYVKDVPKALAFFAKAFGFQTRFIHESNYGELCTGETTLSFASHDLGTKNLPDGYISADSSPKPFIWGNGDFPSCSETMGAACFLCSEP